MSRSRIPPELASCLKWATAPGEPRWHYLEVFLALPRPRKNERRTIEIPEGWDALDALEWLLQQRGVWLGVGPRARAALAPTLAYWGERKMWTVEVDDDGRELRIVVVDPPSSLVPARRRKPSDDPARVKARVDKHRGKPDPAPEDPPPDEPEGEPAGDETPPETPRGNAPDNAPLERPDSGGVAASGLPTSERDSALSLLSGFSNENSKPEERDADAGARASTRETPPGNAPVTPLGNAPVTPERRAAADPPLAELGDAAVAETVVGLLRDQTGGALEHSFDDRERSGLVAFLRRRDYQLADVRRMCACATHKSGGLKVLFPWAKDVIERGIAPRGFLKARDWEPLDKGLGNAKAWERRRERERPPPTQAAPSSPANDPQFSPARAEPAKPGDLTARRAFGPKAGSG